MAAAGTSVPVMWATTMTPAATAVEAGVGAGIITWVRRRAVRTPGLAVPRVRGAVADMVSPDTAAAGTGAAAAIRLHPFPAVRAEASAATLANALLSTQSTLAQHYFQLRVADEQRRILETTVADHRAVLSMDRRVKASSG